MKANMIVFRSALLRDDRPHLGVPALAPLQCLTRSECRMRKLRLPAITFRLEIDDLPEDISFDPCRSYSLKDQHTHRLRFICASEALLLLGDGTMILRLLPQTSQVPPQFIRP